jgi:hypothetical protein
VNHRSRARVHAGAARRLARGRARIVIADALQTDAAARQDERAGALVVPCDVASSESVVELGDPSESGAPMVIPARRSPMAQSSPKAATSVQRSSAAQKTPGGVATSAGRREPDEIRP